MFDLSGKVALVTGGGRGIGAGCSRWLAAAGAYVIINYAGHKERAEQTLEQIKAAGGDGEIIKADVSKLEEVDAMFEHIKQKFGRLDIHVNNAGVLSRHPFLELPVEEWDRLFNTNARGYFICGQRAARLMAEHGKGRIIDNARAAAFVGLKELAITDHGPSDFYGLDPKKIPQMRRDIAAAKAIFPKLRIWLGVEADIVDTPNGLDVSPEEFDSYDFVNAGYATFNEPSRALQESLGFTYISSHPYRRGEQEYTIREGVLFRESFAQIGTD